MREAMRRLSARPHHVGSAYDRDNAEWILGQFKSYGWDAHIENFDVLFPTPVERVVEMISPTTYKASLQETALPADPRDDGYAGGDVFPAGPMCPAQGVQRGSVADMPIYPGDPLTPGVGATKGAKRLSVAQAPTITKIPVFGDAETTISLSWIADSLRSNDTFVVSFITSTVLVADAYPVTPTNTL